MKPHRNITRRVKGQNSATTAVQEKTDTGSVVCTAVLLAADCSLLVPPTVFSVLCVGGCASCFFVSFVLADCRYVDDVFFCVLLVIGAYFCDK